MALNHWARRLILSLLYIPRRKVAFGPKELTPLISFAGWDIRTSILRDLVCHGPCTKFHPEISLRSFNKTPLRNIKCRCYHNGLIYGFFLDGLGPGLASGFVSDSVRFRQNSGSLTANSLGT